MTSRSDWSVEQSVGAPAGDGRRAQRSTDRTAVRPAQPLGFLIPAAIVVTLFFLLPTLYNLLYAFSDWSAFKSQIRMVGLRNVSRLLDNGILLADLRVTLVYAVLVALFQNLFGLGLALLFEADTTVNRVARTMFFIPVLTSALAVGYVFQALLKPNGVVNAVVSAATGQQITYAWLADPRLTIIWVTLVHAWKWMGLAMLIYLAGLKTINAEVLEAARIDGAGRWHTFRHVKFPLLAPAVTFNVSTALLGSMNSFDVVQATTGGGPGQTTEILNIFIYRTFGQGLFAQATTMSLVLALLIGLLAFPVIIVLRRREEAL